MRLESIESILTTVALKGERIGAQYSWRLGLWIQTVATKVHDRLVRSAHTRGWHRITPNLLISAKLIIPKCDPEYPSLLPPSAFDSRTAEDLLNGFCFLENGTKLDVNEISWLRNPYGSQVSVTRFLFNALWPVVNLLAAYRCSENSGHLDRARQITSSWIFECLYIEHPRRVWDDHVTALRAIALCKLWVACRVDRDSDSKFLGELLSAILRHAEKLTHPKFYRASHNHGVTQAYALLVVGLFFPVHLSASNWVEIARVRLEAQMMANVSEEGVHLEHSPFYHFYVFNQFLYAYQFGRSYGIEFSQAFIDRLKRMMICGAYLLKPDGTLPALGDTCRASPVLTGVEDVPNWLAGAKQIYRYSLSMGASGTVPEENSICWPGAGLALFRSGWGTERKFQNEYFLAVRIRTFDTAHIHRDQLSFELYAYGEDLVVDSGGPYGYGDVMREFFLSTAAHNTVVVDGQNQETGKGEILEWRTAESFDLLVMQHCSYPNVAHRRTILFVRPTYFVVIDRLEASATHAYSQLFHLSPNLTASCEGFAINTTSRSNGPTVKILPLTEEGLAVNLRYGADDPAQGWVCVGEGQKVPNPVVEYERAGSTVEFAVLLVPQAAGISSAVCARMEELPLNGGRRILVTRGNSVDEIEIDKNQRVTIRSTTEVPSRASGRFE
jgi:hypothetical protein